MSSELDVSRLLGLQKLLGADLPEIAATLLREFDAAIGELERAVAAGDLPAGALAAHAARNSALMIDAQPLLDALRTIETGARAGKLADARTGFEQLQRCWPPLRGRLQRLAESPT